MLSELITNWTIYAYKDKLMMNIPTAITNIVVKYTHLRCQSQFIQHSPWIRRLYTLSVCQHSRWIRRLYTLSDCQPTPSNKEMGTLMWSQLQARSIKLPIVINTIQELIKWFGAL